ncbi:prolyl oligopeptidase family serine peptidase [Virgisporangium ochraceum]|uniref:prolyl oligopeptidase n=1 Tax=Virgisporangium ochraceum TaxID=65505 RepID=A0A8J3ZVV9_9ACTN|nr:prolyl oligopeptidase family serine peptidase [Virgisporangium ochraceum]GIJ68450.1 prolyl endopeptidase [Virgisporangium ochraceum]
MRSVRSPYPVAERVTWAETHHGQRVADPYRWLEDPDDERTAAWMDAQERLFHDARAGWPGTDGWRAVLTELFQVTTTSLPQCRGARTFFTRQEAGAEHPTVLVSDGRVDRPLVSPLAVDPSGRTVLEAWHPSVEGHLLAFQLSTGGTEDSMLRTIDVTSGATVDGPIDRVRRSPVAWLPGGEAFYYVRRLPPELHPGEERYHRRVYLHRVGSDPADDVPIFGEGRHRTEFYWASVTADGRWLTVSASRGADTATELWIADLHTGSAEQPDLTPVKTATPARTSLRICPGTSPDDPIWLRTNLDAPRGRVAVSTPGTCASGQWRTLIAERPDAVLGDVAVLLGEALERPLVVVSWTRHSISEVTVHDLRDGRRVATVPLPGRGRVGRFVERPERGHEVWFSYSDFATAPCVLRYDARTGAVDPLPAGSATDPPPVRMREVTFPSHDGVPVRMFILSSAGVPDRSRPTVLTGYGGFGISMGPTYRPDALAWIRAGGVWAVACLRGGGEEGEEWHRAGMRLNKRNVFHDFDAATEHLISHGWTGPDRLGIVGESNGGLLVGVAVTRRPDRYAAAVTIASLFDMLGYERSGMGPSWRAEYGSVDDPADFRNLLAYSPYHGVRDGVAYPPVLLTVQAGDTRVDPSHSRKMCAALQHATSGTERVLLRVERGVGHGRAAQSRVVAVFADTLAFLAHHLGLPPAGSP